MSETYVKLQCERCGGGFERHNSTADNARFCSNACRHDRQSKIPTSERVSYDDPEWDENREKALERDNYTCQKCGKGNSESTLVVHHIGPVTHGGTHSLANLDTLCQGCHASLHASGLALTEPIKGPLFLERERELLEQGVPIDYPTEQVVERFDEDVAFLKEHFPEVHDLVVDAACEEEDDD